MGEPHTVFRQELGWIRLILGKGKGRGGVWGSGVFSPESDKNGLDLSDFGEGEGKRRGDRKRGGTERASVPYPLWLR